MKKEIINAGFYSLRGLKKLPLPPNGKKGHKIRKEEEDNVEEEEGGRGSALLVSPPTAMPLEAGSFFIYLPKPALDKEIKPG